MADLNPYRTDVALLTFIQATDSRRETFFKKTPVLRLNKPATKGQCFSRFLNRKFFLKRS